jgi:NAD(P)-dependent dehydrogenase (short-subunit alcohol dehydrogenase family)
MKPAVLVTGGARRLGAAICQAFAQAGWHVVIHYGQSAEAAQGLAASLPSADCVPCDLADSDAAVAMVAALATRLDDWRVLVNCAAVFNEDTADRLDPATFDEAMQVNAATPARMAQAFLQQARAQGGKRVIHVTDQKLLNPNPDFFSYTMSKHALDATIRMLAMAQSDSRDRVYGLAPGAILASHDQTESEADVSHRLNPLGRRTEADEIARAALFLAQGWLASGESLFIDSGQHLAPQPRDVLYLARQ